VPRYGSRPRRPAALPRQGVARRSVLASSRPGPASSRDRAPAADHPALLPRQGTTGPGHPEPGHSPVRDRWMPQPIAAPRPPRTRHRLRVRALPPARLHTRDDLRALQRADDPHGRPRRHLHRLAAIRRLSRVVATLPHLCGRTAMGTLADRLRICRRPHPHGAARPRPYRARKFRPRSGHDAPCASRPGDHEPSPPPSSQGPAGRSPRRPGAPPYLSWRAARTSRCRQRA
jgi:hypothetical protein